MFGEVFLCLYPMFHKHTFVFCLRLHNCKKHSCRRIMISTSFAIKWRHLNEKCLGCIFVPTKYFTLLEVSLIKNSGEIIEAKSRRCILVAICCMSLLCLHVSRLFACFSFVLHVCVICLHESWCSHLRTSKMLLKRSDARDAASLIKSNICAGLIQAMTRRKHDDYGEKREENNIILKN